MGSSRIEHHLGAFFGLAAQPVDSLSLMLGPFRLLFCLHGPIDVIVVTLLGAVFESVFLRKEAAGKKHGPARLQDVVESTGVLIHPATFQQELRCFLVHITRNYAIFNSSKNLPPNQRHMEGLSTRVIIA